MATYYLKTPLSEQDVTQLKLGDVVYITGDAFYLPFPSASLGAG